MHAIRFSLFSLFCVVISLSVIIGCDSDDDNNPPTTGTLNGTVIFHGDWPDSGAVQLSIFTNWDNESTGCYWCSASAGGPPTYATDATHFQNPDPANLVDADTLDFELVGITLGTYETVVAGWRRPVRVNDIECDEPVIGMLGAEPTGSDTIPDPITFSDGSPEHTITLHAYFDRIPDCGEVTSGTISGVARVDGEWPPEGLLVMLTTAPASAWQPVMIQPSAMHLMPTAADTVFSLEVSLGTYYASIWTNAQPPNVFWYGSFGVSTALPNYDAMPDPITITADDPDMIDIVVPGNSPAPHYISGDVTFNGDRPPEGLLVMLTTFPLAPPAFPVMGPPSSMFGILDDQQTIYAHSGIPDGTYYVSLWNFAQQPQDQVFYAAYDPDEDGTPDALEISADNWGFAGVDIEYTAP